MTKKMTEQPTSEYMKQLEAGELPEQVASIQDRMATVNEDEVRQAIHEGQTGTSITSAATMTFVNEATGEKIPLTLPVTMTPIRPKKVAIIGFTEHREKAPYNDPEWEIWGLNELYSYIPRWTRWFELHIRDKVKATPRDPAHLEKLKGLGCPVYMHDQYLDIPNSVRYPLEAMIQMFGSYFTNSISYMLALAIAEGFTEIGVYGVNMSHNSEYGPQRPSCEYFLGIAVGRGIKITLPMECDLLKAKFLYGYQEEDRNAYNAKLLERKALMIAKVQEIDRDAANLQAQLQQLHDNKQQHIGALQDTDFHLQTWDVPMLKSPGG